MYNLKISNDNIVFENITSHNKQLLKEILIILRDLNMLDLKVIMYKNHLYDIKEVLKFLDKYYLLNNEDKLDDIYKDEEVKELLLRIKEVEVHESNLKSISFLSEINNNANIINYQLDNNLKTTINKPVTLINEPIISKIEEVFDIFIENTILLLNENEVKNGKIEYSDIDSKNLMITYNQNILGLVINKDGTYSFDSSYYNFLKKDEILDLETEVFIHNEKGANSSSLFNITLIGSNDTPTINIEEDKLIIDEDNQGRISFTTNDIDGDLLSTSVFASNGIVILNENEILYTPNKNFNGTDTIIVNVDDGNGGIVSKNIDVIINSVNDAPIASDDGFFEYEVKGASIGTKVIGIYENGSTVNLLEGKNELITQNDFYSKEHKSLGYIGYNYLGENKWFSKNGINIYEKNFIGGVIEFEDGSKGLIKSIYDGYNDVENSYVYYYSSDDISIGDYYYLAREDRPIDINVNELLKNDFDIENDNISLISVKNALNGTVELNNGIIKFIPNNNFFGNAYFEYELTDGTSVSIGNVHIHFSGTNDAPTSNDDIINYNYYENEIKYFLVEDLLKNDFDIDGDEIEISSISNAFYNNLEVGELKLVNIDGEDKIKFTPNSNLLSLDKSENLDIQFKYTIKDKFSTSEGTGKLNLLGLLENKPIIENINTNAIETDNIQTITAQINQYNNDLRFYSQNLRVISSNSEDITSSISDLSLEMNLNGSYSIKGNFDFLSENEKIDIIFDYYVKDNYSVSSDIKTVKIQMSGKNDIVTLENEVSNDLLINGKEVFNVEGSTVRYATKQFGDEFIEVNPNYKYKLSATVTLGDENGNYNPTNTQYFGVICHDIDKNVIGHEHTNFRGEGTYLVKDLNIGDTKIYVADASTWYNSSNSYFRGFAWFGYEDSFGNVYDDFTYTRNVKMRIYDEGGIKKLEDGTYEINLNKPWDGAELKVGEVVANSTLGGSYNYSVLSAKTLPEGINEVEAVITGYENNNASEGWRDGVNGFRQGTKYIKTLILANYHDKNEPDTEGDIGGGVLKYENLSFKIIVNENEDLNEDNQIVIEESIAFKDNDANENKIYFSKEAETLGDLILSYDKENQEIDLKYIIEKSQIAYLNDDEIKEENFTITIEDLDYEGNSLGTISQREIKILIEGETDNLELTNNSLLLDSVNNDKLVTSNISYSGSIDNKIDELFNNTDSLN